MVVALSIFEIINSFRVFVCPYRLVFFKKKKFLSKSVCADRFTIYFDCYCIAPRKVFISFSFFGISIFVIDSSLSCGGRIPFWSILCPIHSASVLKNSHFFAFSLYPASSSFFIVSFTSVSCFSTLPLATIIISSSQAGCLNSSVLSIRS